MANEMFYKSIVKLTSDDRKKIGFVPPNIQKVLMNPSVPKVNKASYFVYWEKGKKAIFAYDERNLDEDPASVVDWEVKEE